MRHLDDGSLQAWLDGERSGLERAELEALEKHVEGCPECAARAEELDALTRRTTTLLAGHVGGEAAPAYREVVSRARALGRSGRGHRWTATAWAASVAVALGAGWLGNEVYRSGAGSVATPPPGAVEAGVAPPGGSEAAPGESAAAPAAPVARQPDRPVAASPSTAPAPTGATGPASPAPAPAAIADAPANVDAASPPSAGEVTRAAAPREPVVRGRVVDRQSGEPVPAAQVYIADLDIGVLTLQDGSFRLPLLEEDVDEGPLTLTVQRIGYRTENRDFTARPGETVTVDFGIDEEALQLDEIIVTGTPGATQRRALGNAVAAGPSTIRVSSVDPALGEGGAWSARAPAEARAAVGFAIASVPGLDVSSVEVGRLGGVDALRIRQSLGRNATLTLLQARAPVVLDGATTLDGRAVSVIRRGDVSIVGAAPVPVDSLSALLSQLR